jgi:hypothetical protein
MIAPTMVCEMETLMPDFSITRTASAADNDTANAEGSVFTPPSEFRVSVVFCPLIIAPSMMNMEAMVAAVLNFSIFVPTAVPNMLALSFAPNDHPRNSPLDKKSKYSNIN